ncbi:TonB-dependent receptor domain-containing protein [Kordiimonas aestuarii]|uniref:TonB-dependent receptor domain-containing protein n=1 Tax=Kordiimonas aestuarii TaxID=1005925 RepID=UPI0021D0EAF5|nr:TonB-dependent receptor [Kordiimonas aestuarii]
MKNLSKNALRAQLLGGTAAALALALTGAAAAQDAAVDETLEEVVVTGSRIVSPDISSVSPVHVIGGEFIRQSGATNIQEILLESPQFGVPGLSRSNSAFLTSGTGAATVDLRDLGSDRTLVLFDGRRVVAGRPGTATVDLNVIPTQFIERVDVLTGGASSLYGSDAVAGVVNFVFKKDFEGVEATAQYGITEEGDDEQYQASVTAGGNFADGKGNMMLHIGYSDQQGVLSRERDNTMLDDIDLFRLTGNPDDFGTPSEPFLSSFPTQGRFDTGSGRTWTYGQDGELRPCFSTNGGTAPANCGDYAGEQIGPDGFNRQNYRTIAVPVQRYLFAARGHYEVAENLNFFAEGTYANTRSSREIEPFALGSDNIYPASGGLMNIETVVNGVTMVNPLVPDAIVADAVDSDGDGLRDISFARRLLEFGSRTGSVNRDFFRFAAGFEGSILDDKFNWDVSYVYGRTTESQQSNGQVNVLNFASALAGIQDVNDANNNGSTTDVICANADARAQGCVPINIFGNGSISQDAINYIAADQTLETRITQQVINANISGSLFEMPAGPLGVAIGGEYRKESSSANNDALTNAGLNAGNALPDTAGSFNVKELYAELNIPILADMALAESMNLRGAGRISDYSTVGTVYTYSVGLDWSPIEDIKFRATYARSVRAPNIGELFTGPSQTFPSGLTDPCAGVGATGGGATGDNCRSNAGVAANIAANGTFTINQSDLQGISGFNSGNEDLFEETSDSYTIGVVLTPSNVDVLRNFTITADYFSIEVKDAIVAPPRQFILDQCYAQGDAAFCDLITRRPTATATNSTGSIEFINAPLVNGGALKTEGLDITVRHATGLEGIGINGTLNSRITYTNYFKGYTVPVPGADRDPFVGEIGDPKHRFTANMTYSHEKFDIGLTGTYLGKSYEDDQFLAAFGLEPDDISVGAEVYLDLNATYRVGESVELFGGIDNLLDNKAPNLLSGTTFNVTGTDTAADVYDVLGRRFFVGARVKF